MPAIISTESTQQQLFNDSDNFYNYFAETATRFHEDITPNTPYNIVCIEDCEITTAVNFDKMANSFRRTEGVTLVDFEDSKRRYLFPIQFKNITFEGSVNFRKCFFQKGVHFIDCTFTESSSFEGCSKFEEISIQGCHFYSKVNLSLAKASKVLIGVRHEGDNFKGSPNIFEEDVDLSFLQSNEIHVVNNHFKKTLYFHNNGRVATCDPTEKCFSTKQGLHFKGSIFNTIKIEGYRIHGGITFNDCQIEDCLSLENSDILGPAPTNPTLLSDFKSILFKSSDIKIFRFQDIYTTDLILFDRLENIKTFDVKNWRSTQPIVFERCNFTHHSTFQGSDFPEKIKFNHCQLYSPSSIKFHDFIMRESTQIEFEFATDREDEAGIGGNITL